MGTNFLVALTAERAVGGQHQRWSFFPLRIKCCSDQRNSFQSTERKGRAKFEVPVFQFLVDQIYTITHFPARFLESHH